MKDLVCDVFLLGFSGIYLYQIICYIAKCKQKKYSSLELYKKSAVVLLNMEVSVHCEWAKNENGRELRSCDKTEMSSRHAF